MRQLVISQHQANFLLKRKDWITLLSNSKTVLNEIKNKIEESNNSIIEIELSCSAKSRNNAYTSHAIPFFIELNLDIDVILQINKDNGSIIVDKLEVNLKNYQTSHSGLIENPITLVVKHDNEFIRLLEYAKFKNCSLTIVASRNDLVYSLVHIANEAYLDTVGRFVNKEAVAIYEKKYKSKLYKAA